MAAKKFKPGQSGNPAGRPKNKTPATLLRQSIADAMPEIITQLVNAALNGDTAAAKVLLDRVCPVLKPQAMPVSLSNHGSLSEQGNEIISVTMAGQISPDIASMLISALANQAKLIETDDLAKRIEVLEHAAIKN